MTLQDHIQDIQEQTSAIIEEFIETIHTDQNPDINVLCEKPMCFTMMRSKLSHGTILSPEFYDFSRQGRFIAAMIRESKIEQIEPRLEGIIKTGFLPNITIKDGDNILKTSSERIKIHPHVIECIKRVI